VVEETAIVGEEDFLLETVEEVEVLQEVEGEYVLCTFQKCSCSRILYNLIVLLNIYRGRGGGRGGRRGKFGGGQGSGKSSTGGRGMKGGSKILIEPHRHEGIFIARGKEDALVTLNISPGISVYGEKRINIDTSLDANSNVSKLEYRVWNPFRSKLAAAVLGGVDNIWIEPTSKVLYLGAAAGTSVSHVSDIVGPNGLVYAVEFSHRPGRDLLCVAKGRTNIVPIIEDARHPLKYRMMVGMVDVIFADVAQPDQARIMALNAHHFLKNGGHAVMAIKASCIDSTAAPEAVFRREITKLHEDNFRPLEQITLEPYERDHAVVIAEYRPNKKRKDLE